MPIYAYRCDGCGELTEHIASVSDIPDTVACDHCGSNTTHRVISRVAYHASEATKTARLDPKYEKMVDHAMSKSTSADENRLIRQMDARTNAKKQ